MKQKKNIFLILLVSFQGIILSAQNTDTKSGTIKVSKPKSVDESESATVIRPYTGDTTRYRTRKPLIVAGVLGKYGIDKITIKELLSAKGLDLTDTTFHIVSFEISFNINGAEISVFTNGSDFSIQQINLISRIKVGNKLYVEKIKCKAPDGIVEYIDGISLKIVPDIVGQANSKDSVDSNIKKPFIIASINGKYGTDVLLISKMELAIAKRIELTDGSVKIVAFDMTYTDRGIEFKEHSNSDLLTAKMKESLPKLKVGSKVNFENITYKCSDGKTKYYGNLKFKLLQ